MPRWLHTKRSQAMTSQEREAGMVKRLKTSTSLAMHSTTTGEDATATKSSAQMSTVAQASCSGYLPGQGRKTAQAHGLGPTWAPCKICIK